MRKPFIIFVIILTFMLTGCNLAAKQESTSSRDIINIARHPQPANYNRGALYSLPVYNPNSQNPFTVDLRSYDLTQLNIKNRVNDLMYADFDSRTIWPKDMPYSFNPKKIMELGKSPGLGIKKLHKTGVTGKGVGIAIIDQVLLVNHVEYKDNIKLYEEIHCSDKTAQMHGPAVASIAVGKNTGVAPEADSYYESPQEYLTKFGVKEDQVLLIPMDSRTTASPTGNSDYAFYRTGGWSWSIPYISGLYALACQVKPDITPDIFWAKALQTGDTINVQYNGKAYEFKKIVNPMNLIEALRSNK